MSAETVVARRDERGERGDLHGINAWKTSGAELRRYQEEDDYGS